MYVVLDTNILVQDFWLKSASSVIFFNALNLVPAKLLIPEIVLHETINKYKENLIQLVEQNLKTQNELSNHLKDDFRLPPIDIKISTEAYEKYLRSTLQNYNAIILAYPTIDHKDVVKSILERQKPFRKGDSGYRDFLIWQILKRLEVHGTEELVFLTNNIRDFGEHGYLSEEFKDKWTRNKNYKICIAVSKFNDEYVLPKLKHIEKLKEQLILGTSEQFDIKKWIEKSFFATLKNIDFGEIVTGFPNHVGEVRAHDILGYEKFDISDVKALEGQLKLIQFFVICKVNFSIEISAEDYENNKEVQEFINEDIEGIDYTYTMTAAFLEVKLNIILEEPGSEPNDVQIVSIKGPKGLFAINKSSIIF